MADTEIFKAIVGGVPAALISLVVALSVLWVTQRKQDERERNGDLRKLRDAQRERVRNSAVLILEQVWAQRALMDRYYNLWKFPQGEDKRFEEEYQRMDDDRSHNSALISVDSRNESIAASYAQHAKLFDEFVEAFRFGIVQTSQEFRVKYGNQMVATRAAAAAEFDHLLILIRAELAEYSQPL